MVTRTILQSAFINVMTAAVRKAARPLLRDFGEVEHLQVSQKGPGDFVSAADLRSEKTLIYELSKARPTFSILSEEAGLIEKEDKYNIWIIDPLDGTSNFLHSLPFFSITVALYSHGEIIAGVIYDPIRDELFWADRGAGAFINNRRLRVSSRKYLNDAMIAMALPSRGHGDLGRFNKVMEALSPKVAGIRRLGSASLELAYVGAGRLDGFFEERLAPWDMAAGALIVGEAGGHASDVNGKLEALEHSSLIAANGFLYKPLQDVLQPICL